MTHTIKVHLDTDIGGDPDDVCALALLLRAPGVVVTGVTTVTEQQGRRAGYVHEVIRLAGARDIPGMFGITRRLWTAQTIFMPARSAGRGARPCAS